MKRTDLPMEVRHRLFGLQVWAIAATVLLVAAVGTLIACLRLDVPRPLRSAPPATTVRNDAQRLRLEDERAAAAYGEGVLRAKYGNGVTFNRPYLVQHDEQNHLWIVQGSDTILSFFASHYTPTVIFTEDGDVLDMYEMQF